jgi:hypothetical protein
VLPQDKMENYCELIAAIKVRTSNKKGRHPSTGEAIRLIEEFGIETPDGLIRAQKSMLKTTTVNRAICGSGATTTRHCADSPQQSVFKPNTAMTANNST